MDYSPFYCKNFYKERRKKAKEIAADSSKSVQPAAPLPSVCPEPVCSDRIEETELCPATPLSENIGVKVIPKYSRSVKRKKRKVIFVAILLLLCFGIVMVSADLFSGGSVVSKLQETFGSDYLGKHYLIVQGGYPVKTTAESEALAVRKSGAAGYIYNANNNYYVVLASYSDKKSATSVKNKNKGVEIIELTMRQPSKKDLSDSQKKVSDRALDLVLSDIDTLYILIDKVAKNEMSPQIAHSELSDMRNKLLFAKEELIDANFPIQTRNAHLNIIDPMFGGLDAIVYKEPGENFLAEMRYALIGSIVSFK